MAMAETAAAKPKLTEEEFLRLPDDGRKYELVDGEAKEVPAGVEHDAIVVRIGFLMYPFAQKFGILTASSAGFRMVTGNIRSPDVSFVLRERLPEGKPPKGFMDGAPDLAIEVISPNEDWAEMGRKLGEYFMSGAKEVWLVDPDKVTVTVYKSLTDVQVFHADDEITGGDLLPDFRCKVADLVALE
ncbi:MAG: Uma2 family endonuclease [Armatimonadetes bacterium]|nr:Uma2 family endonuclease [Armatimonadota bacterium]